MDEGSVLEDKTVRNMADELIALAATSKSGKVTIIGHSNGGLVGKLLIDELVRRGHADLVDTFIMVAVPQLGTPGALAGLLHGDKQTIPEKFGILMGRSTARTLGENMPSGYALLPSTKYFFEVFDAPIEFDPEVSAIYDFRSFYGDSVDSKSEIDAFLLGESGARVEPSDSDTDSPNVLNASLLHDASVLQDHLDAWTAPAGIKIVQIVGWGLDTIRGIRYDDCDILFCPQTLNHLDRELLFVDDGDGTVVVPSANAMDAETYYVNLNDHNKSLFRTQRNRDHADILEVKSVEELIKSIVRGNVDILPDFITPTKPLADEGKRLRFRIHSPVSLDIYDADGNHTGLIATSTEGFRRFEAQIPNSYYTEFGEVKYAGADADEPVTLTLVGQATGTFTLDVDEVQGGTVGQQSVFADILVVTGARATVEITNPSVTPILSLDMDADGTPDAEIAAGEGVSAEELLGILRGIMRTLPLPPKKGARLDKIFAKIEKQIAKEEGCATKKKKETCEHRVKHKTDRILARLSALIEKMSQGKKAVLTAEEASDVLNIIRKIQESTQI